MALKVESLDKIRLWHVARADGWRMRGASSREISKRYHSPIASRRRLPRWLEPDRRQEAGTEEAVAGGGARRKIDRVDGAIARAVRELCAARARLRLEKKRARPEARSARLADEGRAERAMTHHEMIARLHAYAEVIAEDPIGTGWRGYSKVSVERLWAEAKICSPSSSSS
jgi:outer membrane murein-binding lipoprotein Lpp